MLLALICFCAPIVLSLIFCCIYGIVSYVRTKRLLKFYEPRHSISAGVVYDHQNDELLSDHKIVI